MGKDIGLKLRKIKLGCKKKGINALSCVDNLKPCVNRGNVFAVGSRSASVGASTGGHGVGSGADVKPHVLGHVDAAGDDEGDGADHHEEHEDPHVDDFDWKMVKGDEVGHPDLVLKKVASGLKLEVLFPQQVT